MKKWILLSACLATLLASANWAASALADPRQGRLPANATGEQVASAAGWTDIMTEDFEGAFPGTTWTLEPDPTTPADPTWGKTTYRKHGGTASGYCVGDPHAAPGPYPNNVDSWMIYGPFDLSSSCGAEFEYWAWFQTEYGGDWFKACTSRSGTTFGCEAFAYDFSGWERHRKDLTSLRGESEVWIAFGFESNSSVVFEGAYVDDIIVRTTDAAPAHPPVLNFPADDGCTTDAEPEFGWHPVGGAIKYLFQLDDSSSFTSPEIDTESTDPRYTASSPLADGRYYWRVRPWNACGDGPWSEEWTLYIGPPASAVSQSTPEDGSHTCDTTPTFDWSNHSMASDFRLQVDTDPGFGSPDVDLMTGGYSVHTLTSPLFPGTYFWRVRPFNHCGDGPWSDVWGFFVHGPPGAPGSPSPADGAVGLSLDTDLDWADATNTMTYTVHFGTTSPPPVYSTTTTSELELPRLSQSTDYYWNVIASNSCGNNPGPIWHFLSNRPPHNGTVDPSSGSGPAGSTTYITTTWTDADGWDNLKQCYFHIGDGPALADSVTLLYNAKKNKLWMWYDAGTSWIGGYGPETNAAFGHELATLDCQLSTVHTAGPEVQVTWALWFDARFSGDKKTGLKCKDINKAKAKGQWKGTWTVE